MTIEETRAAIVAADVFVECLPDSVRLPEPDNHLINKAYLNELTAEIQDFIAHVISSLIDAGSERDAVNESEALRTAIYDEIRGWSDAVK